MYKLKKYIIINKLKKNKNTLEIWFCVELIKIFFFIAFYNFKILFITTNGLLYILVANILDVFEMS